MATTDIETLSARVQALAEIPALLKPFTVTGTKLRLPEEIGRPLRELVAQVRPMLDSTHYEGVEYDYQNEGNDDVRQAAEDVAALDKRLASLKARVEALGYNLYVTTEGTQLVVDHYRDSDRTPEIVFIHSSDADDELEDWIADREQVSERVRRGNGRALENAHDGLRGAAERVVKALEHARENHWPTVTLENDGGYIDSDHRYAKALRSALDDLDTALDVETDTTQVLASRGPNEEFAKAAGDRIDALDRARDDAQSVAYDAQFLIKAALKLNTEGDDEPIDGSLEQVLLAADEKLRQIVNDLDSGNFGKGGAQ